MIYPDMIVDLLLDQIESLVASTAESHKHQSLALLTNRLSRSFTALNSRERQAVARMAATVVKALPTQRLATGISDFAAELERQGFASAGTQLVAALRTLERGDL